MGNEAVKDTAFLLNKLGSLKIFNRADLYAIMMDSDCQASDSIVNHLIGRMVQDGSIIRLGRNQYTVAKDKKYIISLIRKKSYRWLVRLGLHIRI